MSHPHCTAGFVRAAKRQVLSLWTKTKVTLGAVFHTAVILLPE